MYTPKFNSSIFPSTLDNISSFNDFVSNETNNMVSLEGSPAQPKTKNERLKNKKVGLYDINLSFYTSLSGFKDPYFYLPDNTSYAKKFYLSLVEKEVNRVIGGILTNN